VIGMSALSASWSASLDDVVSRRESTGNLCLTTAVLVAVIISTLITRDCSLLLCDCGHLPRTNLSAAIRLDPGSHASDG